MRALVIFRPNETDFRRAEELFERLQNENPNSEVQKINPDENSSLVKLYDVVEYPSVLILADDGRELYRANLENFSLDSASYFLRSSV